MSKSYPIFMAAIGLVLAVLACCPAPPTPIVKTAVPAQPEQAEEPESTEALETQAPLGSSRSSPAPPGSEVEIGDITLAVQGAIRPADDIVAEANMFNDEPADGNEYLMIEVSITCNKGTDETCDISPRIEFKLVGSTGIVRELEHVAGIEGRLETGEMFGGATMSGKMAFEVEKGETDLVLIYTEFLGMDEAYLALP